MNKAEFYIDAMRSDDYPRVSEIFTQGIESGNATYDTASASWADWDGKHVKALRWVARANSDNEVLAWVALSLVSSRAVFSGVAEVSIYVDTRYLGMGLGNGLMKKIIETSENLGFWTLQSGVFPENIGSLKLHQKHGFREVGYRENLGQMADGRWRNIVLLERRRTSN